MRALFIINIISAIFLLANCNSGIKHLIDERKIQCSILDSILVNSEFSKIIGLDKAKSAQPYIRFFYEKSKVFSNCNSIYFTKNKVPISYFILPKVSYYLNTGQFRDIVIYEYKENKREIYISLIAAHYENQLEKEGVPFFEFTFNRTEFGYKFEKLKITSIREQPPLTDYNKYGN
jgi:hypothetical protein